MAQNIQSMKQKTRRLIATRNLEWQVENFQEMQDYLEEKKEAYQQSPLFDISDEALNVNPYVHLKCYMFGEAFGLAVSVDEKIRYSAIHYRKKIVDDSEREDETDKEFCYYDMKDGTQYEDLTKLQENSVQRNIYYSGGTEGKMITNPCNDLKDDILRIGVIIGFRVFVDDEIANKDDGVPPDYLGKLN